MFKKLFILSLLTASVGAFGQGKFIAKNAYISFYSSTPMEDIFGESNESVTILNGETGEIGFQALMTTFHFKRALMEEHFNENYMESDQFPNASFSGHIIEEDDFTKDGIYNIRAKGKFIIHGVEQERILQGDLTVKAGVIKLSCIFTVFLSEHDIKVPRIVHEKLASEIKVIMAADFIKK